MNNNKFYEAYKTWIDAGIKQPSDYVVATLDCKPNISFIQLQKSISHLLNIIDQTAYGRHKPNRLKRIVVLEGGASHWRQANYPKKHNVELDQSQAVSLPIIRLPIGRARQQSDPNPHAHMIIQTGGAIQSQAELIQLIDNTWQSLRESGKYGKIEPYDPARNWSGYLAVKLAAGSDPGSEATALRLSNW
jgi:hypothetical protein